MGMKETLVLHSVLELRQVDRLWFPILTHPVGFIVQIIQQ